VSRATERLEQTRRELNQLKAQRNQANSQLKYMQERHDRTEDSAERCSSRKTSRKSSNGLNNQRG